MSKEATAREEKQRQIPVPDIYDGTDDSAGDPEQGGDGKGTGRAPEYHEPEGFDPYDTASLHQKVVGSR